MSTHQQSKRMLDLAITWLPIVGAVIVGYGITIWFSNTGNKTHAVWLGFAGCVMLMLGLAIHFQKLVWADAAKPATPTDAEVRQLRAYVSAVDAGVVHSPGSAPRVFVVVKNTGQTTALDLTWRAKFSLGPQDAPVSLDQTIPAPKITLQSGASLSYDWTFEQWQPSFETLLQSGSVAIIAVGEVRYRDVFGIDRFANYRLLSGGSYGRPTGTTPGKFSPDSSGNNSN